MRVKAYAGTWAHRTSCFFGLCRRSTNVPLGWVLSQSTRDRMETQLTREQCLATNTSAEPIFDNPGSSKVSTTASPNEDFPTEAGRMFLHSRGRRSSDRLCPG